MKEENADLDYSNPYFDFEKRLVLEREIEKNPESYYYLSVEFDESSEVLVYPSMIGIKFFNIHQKKV